MTSCFCGIKRGLIRAQPPSLNSRLSLGTVRTISLRNTADSTFSLIGWQIIAGGLAEVAGIKINDVIIAINETTVGKVANLTFLSGRA